MKLLALIILGGLFGSAACYKECFKEKSLDCNRKLQADFSSMSDYTFCKFQRKILKCLTTPAEECNMRFKTNAQTLDSVVEKICVDKSDEHKMLEKNRQCIVKVVTDSKCLKRIVKIMKDISNAKDILKAQKEVCRHLDEIAECTVQMVKKACGEEVMTFFKSLYEPAIELHRGICEDVILPENEDTFTTKRFEKTSLPSFTDLWNLFSSS